MIEAKLTEFIRLNNLQEVVVVGGGGGGGCGGDDDDDDDILHVLKVSASMLQYGCSM